MTSEDPEVLSDREVAALLRSVETTAATELDLDLLENVLATFDAQQPGEAGDLTIIHDEHDLEPRRHQLTRRARFTLLTAVAALVFVVVGVGRQEQSTTIEATHDGWVPTNSAPTATGGANDGGVRQTFSFGGGSLELFIPDGIEVADVGEDEISFRAPDVDLRDADAADSAPISISLTGSTNIDDEIARLVSEGAVVVNDSRVRVNGELRSRWELVVANETTDELGCAGIGPCLVVPTDRAAVDFWSGVPTIVTSLEVEPGVFAVWLVRTETYQDPLEVEVSRQMLDGIEFG